MAEEGIKGTGVIDSLGRVCRKWFPESDYILRRRREDESFLLISLEETLSSSSHLPKTWWKRGRERVTACEIKILSSLALALQGNSIAPFLICFLAEPSVFLKDFLLLRGDDASRAWLDSHFNQIVGISVRNQRKQSSEPLL